LKKPLLLAACIVAVLFFAECVSGRSLAKYADPGAFSLVVLYATILILGRYSPGRCLYRILVLKSPRKYAPSQVRKAVAFATFAGTRLLFAGLIFTLVEIARALAAGGDFASLTAALAAALNASLYAFILYLAVKRFSGAAGTWARLARERAAA
jgi:hypothetical protein